jgi:putative oxidoreductase
MNTGLFLLRLFISFRLLYGVLDNVFSWERMIEFSKFLEANHIPFPLVSAVVSVYVQLIGGILLLIGFKTRIASLLIMFNFIVAMLVHLRADDSIEGMTPPMAMLVISLTLFFTGPGKWSVDKK